MVLYNTTVVPLLEELQAANKKLLLSLYVEETAFYGS